MANYSVAEARNHLPRLIKIRARPEAAPPQPRDRAAIHAWLKAERDSRKPVNIASVQLLDDMYDETDGQGVLDAGPAYRAPLTL
jgi:hypothetical protein